MYYFCSVKRKRCLTIKNVCKMKKVKISYTAYLRRSFRESYYQKKFSGFVCSEIVVSEFSPCSPQNLGYSARPYWKKVSEEEARVSSGRLWFKNSSFYGASQYYVELVNNF